MKSLRAHGLVAGGSGVWPHSDTMGAYTTMHDDYRDSLLAVYGIADIERVGGPSLTMIPKIYYSENEWRYESRETRETISEPSRVDEATKIWLGSGSVQVSRGTCYMAFTDL